MISILLLSLTPGSETGAPAIDLAMNLRLASTTTHAALSPDWVMSYYQEPRLIETPAPVDAPSKTPADDLPPELAPINAEAAAADGVLVWQEWTMSDLSLEWGLATIGPGVLAPQPGGMRGGPGGGGPGGGGGQQAGPPFFFARTPTPIAPNPPTPGPSVDPIPEPGAFAVWLLLLAGLIAGVNRWNQPPGVLAAAPA